MFVLLVEDHRLLAETVIDYLETESITADYAANGQQGLTLATNHHYDAIILDVNMPLMDGFTVCRTLRQDYAIDTPVLMLTARDQLQDKLHGFEHGADDYLVKPFANEELVMRLHSLVKRYRGEVVSNRLELGELSLDLASQRVWRQQQEITLSPTSFRILRILMRESPKLVTREILEQALWGDNVPDTDVLRSHLYILRKQIDHPFEQAYIQTVKGAGVRLLVPEPPVQS